MGVSEKQQSIPLSTLFKYLYFTWVLFFLKTYDFNFTTFEIQILYISLHFYQGPAK